MNTEASLLHLLSPRLVAARRALARGRGKPIAVAILGAGFWAGAFLFFYRTLAYFQTITALGPVLTQRLLVLVFVSFFPWSWWLPRAVRSYFNADKLGDAER